MSKKSSDQSTELNVKYINYSDNEMNELSTLIEKYFVSLKKQFAPTLDLFLIETVSKHAKKFLLEQKAEYLLDQQSIQKGFESAAHEVADIAQKAADKKAAEDAAQKAVEDAQRKKDQDILDAEVARQAVLKDLRDKEDAQAAAELKAKLKAESLGQSMTGL